MDQNSHTQYSQEALHELTEWVQTVHSELDSSKLFDYPETDARPLDAEYSREIGRYISDQCRRDYTAALFFLDSIKTIYHVEEDFFLVASDAIQNPPTEFEQGLLSHEQGHRMGYKIVDNHLDPIIENREVSEEASGILRSYFLSDNFAERTKVAVGNSLGRDFTYFESLQGEAPTVYRLKDRIGPEELVDPDRDDDLDELLDDVERMLIELSEGVQDWA